MYFVALPLLLLGRPWWIIYTYLHNFELNSTYIVLRIITHGTIIYYAGIMKTCVIVLCIYMSRENLNFYDNRVHASTTTTGQHAVSV